MKSRFLAGIGAVILFFTYVTGVVAGLHILFKPTLRPMLVGWGLLIVAPVLAAVTAAAWRRVLPGIFGCGVLNACNMLISGHLVGQPDKPIQKLHAGAMTAGLMVLAILADIAERKSKSPDLFLRASYGAVVVLLGIGFEYESLVFLSLGGMIGVLGILAVRGRLLGGGNCRKGRGRDGHR